MSSFFFDKATVTGATRLDILKTCLMSSLNNLPNSMILKQGGIPPHWRYAMRFYLPEEMDWSRQSHCLAPTFTRHNVTLLDFFFWEHVTDVVYRVHIADVEELKGEFTQATQMVNQ